VVPFRTKLWLLAKSVAWAASTWRAEELGDTPARREILGPLPETRFLVEAVALERSPMNSILIGAAP
jgi:hypothetical protein